MPINQSESSEVLQQTAYEPLPGTSASPSLVTHLQSEPLSHSLLHIVERLNSTSEVDTLLDILIQEAIALIGAQSGCAGLYTPQGMVCHKYFQGKRVLPLEYCWPPNHGLPGWLIVHKVPYLTNDTLSDQQIVHELCLQFGVRSALSTPILDAHNDLLGFFELHNKQGNTGFTSSDQETLLTLSHLASIALSNALAFQRLQQANRLLHVEIADRRKAEAALQAGEERFRALIEHSYDVILLSKREGNYFYASPSLERVLGYTPEEFVKLNGFTLIHPDDIPSIAQAFQTLLATPGLSETRQFRGRHKNGSWRWVEATATNLLHEPSVHAIVTNFHDIAERKQAEERQHLLNHVSDLLVSSLDHQLTLQEIAELIVPALADYCRIAILDEQHQIKEIKVNHIDPRKIALVQALYDQYKDRATTTHGLQRILEQGKAELISIISESQLEWAQQYPELLAIIHALDLQSYMGVPLVAGGKVIGAITFSSIQPHRHYTHDDLSFAQELAHRIALALDNAQLYRETQQARDQLAIILQGVADGIIVYDKNSQIIYANHAAAKLTDFASVQAMTAMLPNTIVAQYEIIDEQGRPFPPSQLPHRRVLAREHDAQAVIGYREKITRQSEHWSLSKCRPIFDEQGKVVFAIAIIHDITERILAERRKDEFISMASHELKTPLTSLKGFTHVLLRRLAKQGDEQGLTYLAKIDKQVDKLTILINDLLDLSKIQTGKLDYREEYFDLDALVREIVENVQGTTHTHRLLVEGQTHAQVFGDKDRLGQVLINLLTNAIKYSPQADKVIVHLSTEQGQAIVSVQDFGIGIAKEYQQYIFDRFYRVTAPQEQTYPGLGIGLYISSEIIRRHHGRLEVESHKGEGSTFSFVLPLASLRLSESGTPG